MSEFIVKPERPGGFLDFLPLDYLSREKILKTIDRVFRSFGFDPIETPRIEFLKTLSGEQSDTGKNIFHIKGSNDDEPLAMPFDHTVPFARILASNPYDNKKKTGLRLPWKRMCVGPVFRSDTPQSGRFRQFYQFDADIAGTSKMLADAEIIALMYYTMKALNIEKFKIRLNNRKILNGLAILSDIYSCHEKDKTDEIVKEMMRILDKLDKIGLENVISELKKSPDQESDPAPNLSDQAADRIKSFLNIKGKNEEKLQQLKLIFKDIEIAEQGIDELFQILEYLSALNIDSDYIEIDLSIARGLDYYTGPVMETNLTDAPQFGSIFSGGRYNDLVSRFTGKKLPAVGASIGVDRLFAAMDYLGAIDRETKTVTQVMIIRISQNQDDKYLKMASELRNIGINTEICLSDDTSFKGQFNFAISKGVEYVIICGDNEFEKQVIQVKNLNTRVQEEISVSELVSYFKKLSI